ncbi:hypothetical protein K461DRAFT_324960 [Myriangium duriaei CBS 260.36]|uniref:DUF6603 domain-containing protein n=1 Tax=Myriangium duriaei CBS 260.36 TaxID=1168546 RepID=A0A9P4IQ19_9PEZI|nr:hypothetical protein K461DRAFT_324960 [Myriangium duriaei CBS 260.36]
MADYEVKSFFLNIGVGDGAIHVLVNKNQPNQAVSAVLIDGGRVSATGKLLSAITKVAQEYNIQHFDSIVITHWDGDHYEAVYKLLYYCRRPNDGSSLMLDQTASKVYFPWRGFQKIINNNCLRTQPRNANGGPPFDLQARGFGADNNWYTLCEAVYSTYSIGYDLFSGITINTNHASLSEAYDTIDTAYLQLQARPVFLCVGADDRFINMGPLDPLAVWLNDPHNGKIMNASSIMACVIWPRDHGQRISLYTGGDASEPEESRLVDWIGNNDMAHQLTKIDVIKAGHHGSHFSTPENLITRDTCAYVVSAGDEYGHPSFAVLYYLMSLATLRTVDQPLAILATCTPYWLNLNPADLTTLHLNLPMVIGYKNGCKLIAQAIIDAGGQSQQALEWFPGAVEMMKVAYSLEYSATMMASLDQEWGEASGLAHLDVSQVLALKPNKDDAFQTALELAQTEMRVRWSQLGNSKAGQDMEMIYISANVDGITGGTFYLPAPTPLQQMILGQVNAQSTSQITSFVQDPPAPIMESKGIALLVDIDGPDDKTSSKLQQTTRRLTNPDWAKLKPSSAKLQGVTSTRKDDNGYEDLTLTFFTNDLSSFTSQSYTIPATADSYKWFSTVLGSSIVLDCYGTKSSNAVDLTAIEIQVHFPVGTSTPLIFTTDPTVCQKEFGDQVQDPENSRLGYDDRLSGMLFALRDPTPCVSSITIGNFLDFFNFNILDSVRKDIESLSLQFLPPGQNGCGLWFIPRYANRTIYRLRMATTDSTVVESLSQTFTGGLGMLSNIRVNGVSAFEIVQATSSTKRTSTVALEAILTLNNIDSKTPTGSFPISITFTDKGFQLIVDLSEATIILEDIVDWASSITSPGTTNDTPLAGLSQLSSSMVATLVGSINGAVNIRGFSISFTSNSTDEAGLKPTYFEIDLEIPIAIKRQGQDQDQQYVPLLAILSWKNGSYSLEANIWKPMDFGEIPDDLHPYYDPAINWKPLCKNQTYVISINGLLGDAIPWFPSNIPDEITEVSFRFSMGHSWKSIDVEAVMTCSDSANPSTGPSLTFQELEMTLSMEYNSSALFDFTLRFRGGILLNVPDTYLNEYTHDQIQLRAFVEYTSGSGTTQTLRAADASDAHWTVQAEVTGIKVANLWEIFDSDANDAILDVMAMLNIPFASLTYTHAKSTSTLEMEGTIVIGHKDSLVDLGLKYHHDNSSWSFSASLNQDSIDPDRSVNIADLLGGLVDDVSTLPELLRSLSISLSELEVDLKVQSTTGHAKDTQDAAAKHVVFSLSFTIGSFIVSFAQLREYTQKTPRSKPSSGTTTPITRSNEWTTPSSPPQELQPPAKILQFSFSKFPDLPTIPLIGVMPKMPIDRIGIVWSNREITADEIRIFNSEVFCPNLMLLVKDNQATAAGSRKSDPPKQPGPAPQNLTETNSPQLPTFSAGCHFQIATLEQNSPMLVIDYISAQQSSDQVTSRRVTTVASGEPGSGNADEDDPTTPAAVAPMSKTFGPITVSSISLSVKSGCEINMSLDASIKIGPVTVNLIGFMLQVDLSGITNLVQLESFEVKYSLSGLGVSLDKSPTRMSGLFINSSTDQVTQFEGGVDVSIDAWTAIAGGMYQEKSNPSQKSMFVFAMVQGPIADFGFAEIDGITGGFGYNSHLALPDVSGVSDFPFVALNSGSLPIPADNSITNFLTTFETNTDPSKDVISPMQDSIWLAAGLGVKAFQVIEGQAILTLDLSDQPKFGLVADTTAVFPKQLNQGGSSNSTEGAFLVLDLGMVAVVDPAQGIISVAGQLTPKSYILDPSCHLTGGFLFAYFLPESPYSGDFVFSVGGFHPKFTPPTYYPPAPPRVAISWQYDDDLHISGEAYYAITSQAVMGGGKLDINLDEGWVSVSLSAYADFFIHFHPFHFEGNIGVNLSAEINLDLGLFTIHLGPLEFSADLDIQGPPVTGVAYLHLWSWDVAVCFGSSKPTPEQLGLPEFLLMLKNVPIEDINTPAANTVPNQLVTITAGLITAGKTSGSDSGTQAEPTSNEVKTDAPTTPTYVQVRGAKLQFEVQTRFPVLKLTIGTNPSTLVEIDNTTPLIYSIPMMLKDHFQESDLTITLTCLGDEEATPPVCSAVINNISAEPIVKQVPPAIWGIFQDPLPSVPTTSTIKQVMGYSLSIKPHDPSNDYKTIPAFTLRQVNYHNVGDDDGANIPPIPLMQSSPVDGQFALTKGKADTAKRQLATVEARFAAMGAWRAWKRQYSGGGTEPSAIPTTTMSWLAPQKLASDITVFNYSSPASIVFKDRLYVFYSGTDSNDIWYTTCTGSQTRATWDSSITSLRKASNSGIFAAVYTIPSPAVLGDQLYVFFCGAGNNGIFYTTASRDDQGNDTWTSVQPLLPGDSAETFYPHTSPSATVQADQLLVVWVKSDGTTIRYSRSTDGKDWSAAADVTYNLPISNETSAIAVTFNDVVYVFYNSSNDNGAWFVTYQSGQWSSETSVKAAVSGTMALLTNTSPAAFVNDAGILVLLWNSSLNDGVYTTSFDGKLWRAPTSLGAVQSAVTLLDKSSPCGSCYRGVPFVFYVGLDTSVYAVQGLTVDVDTDQASAFAAIGAGNDVTLTSGDVSATSVLTTGGFGPSPTALTNPSSTAADVMAIRALGGRADVDFAGVVNKLTPPNSVISPPLGGFLAASLFAMQQKYNVAVQVGAAGVRFTMAKSS